MTVKSKPAAPKLVEASIPVFAFYVSMNPTYGQPITLPDGRIAYVRVRFCEATNSAAALDEAVENILPDEEFLNTMPL